MHEESMEILPPGVLPPLPVVQQPAVPPFDLGVPLEQPIIPLEEGELPIMYPLEIADEPGIDIFWDGPQLDQGLDIWLGGHGPWELLEIVQGVANWQGQVVGAALIDDGAEALVVAADIFEQYNENDIMPDLELI
jgi:hypothetical protein